MVATTMNGYSLLAVPLATITAGGHSTQVRAGAVATVLSHVARRFHAEVEPLVTFYGWRSVATNAAVGGHPRSNHPSGTALDFNGYRHPYRAPVNFTAAQVAAIRRILAEVAPVVRWGGDFGAALRDGMHFEIVAAAAQVAAVAARLTTHPTPTPTPTPAPTRRHTMRVIRGIEHPEVWVTDGVTKRHIRTTTELGELLRICDQTEPLVVGQFACDAIPAHTTAGAVDVAALAAAIVKALPAVGGLTAAAVTAACRAALAGATIHPA